MDEKFEPLRESVLDTMSIIRINYDQSVEAGMKDPESVLYNQIEDIVDKIKAAEDLAGLEEMVFEAKTIETEIDNWLISIGQSTLGLSWPSF